MDLSLFNTAGTYYISIPGMGRSYPFTIGDKKTVAHIGYVALRGLFHQRRTQILDSTNTYWLRGVADGHLNVKDTQYNPIDFYSNNLLLCRGEVRDYSALKS